MDIFHFLGSFRKNAVEAVKEIVNDLIYRNSKDRLYFPI